MSYVNKQKTAAGDAPAKEMCNLRITLTGKNVKHLEKACNDLKKSALNKELKVRGPVRMPNKVLRLTTRKSPCGEGTNTWDRLEMRIHKRILDIVSPTDVVKSITSISIEPGVNIEVFFRD